MFVRTTVLLVLALALALLPGSHARAQGPQDNPLLLDSPSEMVPALDFTAKTLSGKTVRLSELKGQVVLLNFWATWCVPCLLEMPAMDRLNRKMAGKPFRLLAINQAEDRAQVEKFAKAHHFSFDFVLDPIGDVGSSYGANRLPMSYIIDKQGFVVRRAIGPRQWDNAAAMQLFDNLMDQPVSGAAATVQVVR